MSRRFLIWVVIGVLASFALVGGTIWAVSSGGGGGREAAFASGSTSQETWFLYADTTSGKKYYAQVKSVSDCDVEGVVTQTKTSAGTGFTKSIPTFSYAPCRLAVRLGEDVNTQFYDWLNNAFAQTYTKKNLLLVRKDPATGNLNAGISLNDALIQEVEFPAFDAAIQGSLYMTLTIRPEEAMRISSCCPTLPNPPQSNKAATASNFSVALSGIGSGQLPVSRLDPWGAAVKITEAQPGTQRFPTLQAGELSLTDLVLSVPTTSSSGSSTANALHTWFNSFVIQGNNADPYEKTMTVKFMDSTLTTTLLTLTFNNVGIYGQPDYWVVDSPEHFFLYAEGVSIAGQPASQSSGSGTTTSATTTSATTTNATTTNATTTTATTTAETTTSTRSSVPMPTNLQAADNGSGGVDLRWEPVKANSYRVYYGGDPGGPYKLIGESAEPTTTIRELPAGAYYFVVRAVIGEDESDNSNEVLFEFKG